MRLFCRQLAETDVITFYGLRHNVLVMRIV